MLQQAINDKSHIAEAANASLPLDFYYILIINNIHDVSHKQGTIIGYSIIFQVMPIYHRLTLIFNKKFLSNFFRPPFTPKYLILL